MSRARVSLHAVIRYVERVEGHSLEGFNLHTDESRWCFIREEWGYDLGELQSKILPINIAEHIDLLGSGVYQHGDHCLLVRNYTVVTILPLQKQGHVYNAVVRT